MTTFEPVINFLHERNIKLVTAESCTAGLITSLIADTPGCGSVLEMGFTVYSEKAKHICLGVDLLTMKAFGLTSEEVAREMAQGALDRSGAGLAVAVTGTAESDDDLNGVVCFAYALHLDHLTRVYSETIHFNGDRNLVRKSAAEHAINHIPTYYAKLVENLLDE